jgi:hypothetical protein
MIIHIYSYTERAYITVHVVTSQYKNHNSTNSLVARLDIYQCLKEASAVLAVGALRFTDIFFPWLS